MKAPRRDGCTPSDRACRDACLAGDPPACYERALRLERDPASASEAVVLYHRACELGHASACTNYAAKLWSSYETAPELACAQRIFEKTCAAADPFGCGMLARMMLERANGPDDLARARAFLERSCDRHGGFPCRVLAKELEAQRLGAFEPAQIQILLARACETGDDDACGDPATAAETFHAADDPPAE